MRSISGTEQVGVEVVGDALQDRGHPLEAHAGIDVLLGQGAQAALLVPVELHKHQVPQFQVAVAVAAGCALRAAAAGLGALVVEYLGAGAAGAGHSHVPEVVVLAQAHDPGFGDAHFVPPYGQGFVILFVDGEIEAVQGEPSSPTRKSWAKRAASLL